MLPKFRSVILLAVACLFTAIAPRVRGDDVVQAQHCLIISGHPEATKLGMEVLKRGGSAADALVTVSLALGVVEPGNSGLGGKIILLYYDANAKRVSCLAALDAAPKDLEIDKLLAMNGEERRRGYHAACVPALGKALSAAHEKWGTRPWKSLVEPVANLADTGFVLSPLAAEMLAEFPKDVDAEAARIYAPGGHTWPAGAILRNEDLAHTLSLLAEKGPDAIYKGELAQKLVSASRAAGGWFSEDDLHDYQPRFVEPLCGAYRGYQMYSSPPPLTGGSTLLAALGVLSEVNFRTLGVHPRDGRYADVLARVLQQVYPEVTRCVADVPDAGNNLAKILDPANLHAMARRADMSNPRRPTTASSRAAYDDATLDDSEQACTTHLIIVDAAGNIVCATQSLGNHFGSGVVAPGMGFLLNNDISNFTFTSPDSANYPAPGKWPRSTMTPTIVLRNGKPVLAIGAPGGQRIPTGVLQVTIDVLDFQRPLPEAIDAPRFHLRRSSAPTSPVNEIDVEQNFDPLAEKALNDKGWNTFRRDHSEFYFGAVNAAMFLNDGRILGVADQRRTGDAGGG
jgi:gamma-glutamyltranspeptidase/glutathione hydrolase